MKDNENIYTQQYLERLKSLELKRKVILDFLRDYKNLTKEGLKILQKNFERSEKIQLSKINPLVFSMLLQSLFNIPESMEVKIAEFESNKLSKYVLFEILFWAQPSKYPFPNEEVKKYKDFLHKKKVKMKNLNLDNFLELYAFESFQKDDFLREIKDHILSIRLDNLEEHLWVKDFIVYLDPMEKSEIKSKVHPYIWKVLSSDSSTVPVIIDGNNILMSKILQGPDKISNLLEHIEKLDKVYFPFYIVFDKNAKYRFQTEYFSYKKTYYHSPADELILKLAIEINGVVCSMDRFKNYGYDIVNIWYQLKF